MIRMDFKLGINLGPTLHSNPAITLTTIYWHLAKFHFDCLYTPLGFVTNCAFHTLTHPAVTSTLIKTLV